MNPLYIDPSQPLEPELEVALQAEIGSDERVVQWHTAGENHIVILLISESLLREYADISETFGRQVGGGRRLTRARDESRWSLKESGEWIA